MVSTGQTDVRNCKENVHFFVMTTDRGANEVLARKMWLVLSRSSPEVVCLSTDCYEHAGHLISLQSLKLADALLERHGRSWKYFSSLATSSHTLRDASKLIFQQWCETHGDVSGIKCAKKLWPKCIGGRWNSCSDVETRMREVGGRCMLEPVLRKVLASKAAKDRPQTDQSAGRVDEIGFEEMKRFKQQMGQWRSKTLACASDSLWWVTAEAMRTARSPVLHLSATWQQLSRFESSDCSSCLDLPTMTAACFWPVDSRLFSGPFKNFMASCQFASC